MRERGFEMKNSKWATLCVGLFVAGLVTMCPIRVEPRGFILETMPTAGEPGAQAPEAHDVGDYRWFWAVDYDEDVYYQADAYLLAIGEYCYIYFEDLVISILGEEEASERAELYRDEFDSNIYPRVTALAGNPNGTLGDIDGDPRVYILILENRWDYYRQTNEVDMEHSNMCEMVYICYRAANVPSTIAHEFDHLVWFNHEFDEMHFILEGAAEYATYFAGYSGPDNKTSRVDYFLNDIHDSLIYFEVEAQDYGACYLFTFYLVEQYGIQFLRDLVQHEEDGAAGLESALEGAGHNISFNQLYLDWITALTIDEPGFAGDRYGLRDMEPSISDYTTVPSLPYQNDAVSLYRYGSRVFRVVSPCDRITVEMSQPVGGVAGLSVAYRDFSGWHVSQEQGLSGAALNITGEGIDVAWVIASYLLEEAPAGETDFGSGPEKTVEIVIRETGSGSNTQTGTGFGPLVPLGAAAAVAGGAIAVLIMAFRKR